MSIPPATREDILRALDTFDKEYRDADDWRNWEAKGNFHYAIKHRDKIYPVKFIIELATGHPRGYFSGGSRANRYLEDLDFQVIRISSDIPSSVWWVNQGQNYEIERDEGFIYAGKSDRGGRTPYHWGTLLEVQPNDVIVHYVRGEIRAIGRADSDAYEFSRPTEHSEQSQQGDQSGFRVDVDYFELTPPIPYSQVA